GTWAGRQSDRSGEELEAKACNRAKRQTCERTSHHRSHVPLVLEPRKQSSSLWATKRCRSDSHGQSRLASSRGLPQVRDEHGGPPMQDFLPRSSLSDSSSQDNLFDRIRANLREALRPGGWNTSSANGAPIHLLEAARSRGAGRAQSVSFATHAAVIFLIVAL